MHTSTDSNSADLGELADRRDTNRFPVRQDVRYRVIQFKAARITGTGTTLNMGSRGILFTTQEKLAVGRTVEVSVNWPAKLDGTCPLQFVAIGRVVRSEATCAAVRIEKYEFKTRSSQVLAVSA